MHIIYQQDESTGMFLALGTEPSDHNADGNQIRALRVLINCPQTNPPCQPVENLAAAPNAETKEVTVTWEAPATMVPVEYTIKREGPTAKTVTVPATQTSYIDDVAAVVTGMYKYCVTPVYASGTCIGIAQTCSPEFSIVGIDPCESVENVTGEYNNTEVTLTWDVPATMEPVEYIIMRKGVEITRVTETTYIDDVTEFEAGAYEYCVIPVYEEGTCAGSEAKCVEVSIINNIKEMTKISFSIVPNPASSLITISAVNNFHTVEVVGFLGQTIYSQSNIGNKSTLDVSNYANGVYFVRIISENGVSVNKFVKQ
jgi:hypothetical protein